MKLPHICILACLIGLVICIATITTVPMLGLLAGAISGAGFIGFVACRMFE